MYIMTATGWRRLVPSVVSEAPCEPELYCGPIPSVECQRYVARLERQHIEWCERRAGLLNEDGAPLQPDESSSRPLSKVMKRAA